jgi:hypothetical protein
MQEKAEQLVIGIKIAEWEAEKAGMGMWKNRINGHSQSLMQYC